MEKIRDSAFKYAIFNATQHDGKAQIGPVLGRLFAENPEAKIKAKEIQVIVSQVVTEINEIPLKKQLEIVKQWPELFEVKKEEQKKTLPPLKNLSKFPRVTVRFAPNPDGPLHLGSAESIIFSDEYAKIYNGYFILRFEDTSADVKPPILTMYNWIVEDLKWLGVKIDEIYYQSDRLPIYYEYAEKLIDIGKAYVCICDPNEYKKLYMAKLACQCRELSTKEHLERWMGMLNGKYKRGEAVVRVKTDITHPNPAIRDWPALRISTRAHPRQGRKYRVWPLYNFSCAIDDHLMKISHVIRGKEHEVNSTRQKYVFDHLGWVFPDIINVGRLGLEAGILSKSKIRTGVESGLFLGWDDPRLGTLRALKRRGLQPEAIRQIMLQVGPKPINVTISWGNFAAVNKKIIDPKSNRYFFVQDPVKVEVFNLPQEILVKLPLHPDYPNRGYREYKITPIEGREIFYLPSKELKNIDKKLVRLMGLANIHIFSSEDNYTGIFDSREHSIAREKGAPFIQWLVEDNSIETIVTMPDASKSIGRAELLTSKLDIDEMLQFERFGFVRVDSKIPLGFYYAHD